jgi:plasmid stabilization system protein ParE
MVKRIEWTKKAISELYHTLDYLKVEISENAAERFLNLVEKNIEGIKKHPSKGRLVPNRKTVRFILMGKNHRCYYRPHGSILYITAIFDTRQDSKKRPYTS